MARKKTKNDKPLTTAQRRIEAARNLYLDGDLSREEYLTRKGQAEREIQYWEKRTTETQQVALELAMCVEAVDKVAKMWALADDEDRQGMASNLFEYIVFDLDKHQITDFRLKAWADRFVVLRSELYDIQEGKGSDSEGGDNLVGGCNAVAPTGFQPTFVYWSLVYLEYSTYLIIRVTYKEDPIVNRPITHEKVERNMDIRKRYWAGEMMEDLAREYDISVQRVHQIIVGRKRAS